MTADCLFCKIVAGEIPAEKLYEDDEILAFRDIAPQAPIHILSIPKEHIEKVSDLSENDKEMIGHLILSLNLVAKEKNLSPDGYRIVINCGNLGGQVVNHLHVHLLGGRQMNWPPG